MRIKSTAWAKKFKRECPSAYDDAMDYASQPEVKVFIIKNNELDEKVLMYSIEIPMTHFWMDSFPTREEAVKLCEKMGWEIINE